MEEAIRTQPPDVSVVVATHNRAQRLGRLLAGLEAQSVEGHRFEVIVVDDGSTDETPSVLASVRPRLTDRLRISRREVPAGPAAAREQGWRLARGRLVAFTDDDCVPAPEWLEAGLEGACDPGVFVQGRTEPDPAELDRLGPFSHTITVAEGHPAFQTCNMFYPRELLERLGGFDTESFGRSPGGEDSDLGWRAIEAGARPVFAPRALVRHGVERLGPLGMLRMAGRWTTPMRAYALHPGLRRGMPFGIFWKRTHLSLFRALISLLLPARWAPLRNWLLYPYAREVWARGRVLGGGPLLAPYYVLHDLIEMAAVARGGLRYRRPLL